MDQAAAGGHPLDTAGTEQAAVALVVPVPHPPVEHVSDGFKAAVRMIGKAGDVVRGRIRPELVEHQERIEVAKRRIADDARELDARAVAGHLATNHPDDCTDRAWLSLLRTVHCELRGNMANSLYVPMPAKIKPIVIGEIVFLMHTPRT